MTRVRVHRSALEAGWDVACHITCADCSIPLPDMPEWERRLLGPDDYRCDGCNRAAAWKTRAEKAEAERDAILKYADERRESYFPGSATWRLLTAVLDRAPKEDQ